MIGNRDRSCIHFLPRGWYREGTLWITQTVCISGTSARGREGGDPSASPDCPMCVGFVSSAQNGSPLQSGYGKLVEIIPIWRRESCCESWLTLYTDLQGIDSKTNPMCSHRHVYPVREEMQAPVSWTAWMCLWTIWREQERKNPCLAASSSFSRLVYPSWPFVTVVSPRNCSVPVAAGQSGLHHGQAPLSGCHLASQGLMSPGFPLAS